jgi:predicted double-glycine peptidase
MCTLLTSCASLTRGTVNPADVPHERKVIEGVPFFAQEEYHCGPATLAGVLNFIGERTTPEAVAAKIFREDVRGSTTLDMALYPRTIGYDSRWYSGSMRDLRFAVDSGQPRIIFVDYGIGPVSSYHFMVVVGYDPRGAIVNSGRDEHKLIAWASFMGPWERTGHWTLEIMPKGQLSEQ